MEVLLKSRFKIYTAQRNKQLELTNQIDFRNCAAFLCGRYKAAFLCGVEAVYNHFCKRMRNTLLQEKWELQMKGLLV